jgi:diphosphomevalonate decarboxylase
MVIAIVGYGAKKISSREGMARVVATSVFYRDWLNTVDDDLDNARRAILQRDFTTLGQITEASTYKMHATTMGASPPFCYWQAPTLEVIHQVERLRDHGIECYASVDAGPHVGILCKDVNAHRICEAVSGILGIAHVLITRPGPETKIEESFNEA